MEWPTFNLIISTINKSLLLCTYVAPIKIFVQFIKKYVIFCTIVFMKLNNIRGGSSHEPDRFSVTRPGSMVNTARKMSQNEPEIFRKINHFLQIL